MAHAERLKLALNGELIAGEVVVVVEVEGLAQDGVHADVDLLIAIHVVMLVEAGRLRRQVRELLRLQVGERVVREAQHVPQQPILRELMLPNVGRRDVLVVQVVVDVREGRLGQIKARRDVALAVDLVAVLVEDVVLEAGDTRIGVHAVVVSQGREGELVAIVGPEVKRRVDVVRSATVFPPTIAQNARVIESEVDRRRKRTSGTHLRRVRIPAAHGDASVDRRASHRLLVKHVDDTADSRVSDQCRRRTLDHFHAIHTDER